MGTLATILLAMVVYVDVLAGTVPVFDSTGNAPLILSYFIGVFVKTAAA